MLNCDKEVSTDTQETPHKSKMGKLLEVTTTFKSWMKQSFVIGKTIVATEK